ncbi:50S ribosome-binding GTPase [Nostoc sphaeroides CHAB 2801]|uniref:GTPase n=1 Tax=Nostoc sphaeroides TaxID=446679 RepID=UPI001E3C803A|nr:GTPase domain-containing protein [Nostoc sphaeroides]MCC5633996.1 50S ribosome-binding GTPase [Nostoc sphaeroides CHAB 2801]
MKAIKNIQALLKVLTESGILNDAVALGQYIWNHFTKDYDSSYSDNNPDVIAKTLHRMNNGSAPRIALVGMTSAGKSSLINALFGQSIAEVRRTADTTSCVIKAEFPSGLIIYDTPGLGGNEEFGYENITRLFLGMSQEEDAKEFESVPFQKTLNDIIELSPEQLRQSPILDAVILVVNISRTLNKYEKKAFKSFFFELKARYQGRIVVAGTHIDELNKLSNQEIREQLESYNRIFDNQLIPISSISGEGLAEMVINLFRIMPHKVSPAKLQESLTNIRKLNRLQFVIAESSNLLGEIILLRGDQADDIKALYLWLFALICKQYSVDEETWIKCNGDAFKIGERAKEKGTDLRKIPYLPNSFWDVIQSWFGKKFERDVLVHKRIGVDGLQELMPGVYKLLYGFAEVDSLELSNEAIKLKINNKAKEIQSLVEENQVEEIADKIGEILGELLAVYVK